MGQRWKCGRCGVVASYGAGTAEPAQPEGWVHVNGGWRCLKCRREDAMDEASTGTTSEQKAKRRRALTEFELRRDPDASDQLIAKRAGCSTAAVRPVRAALLTQEAPSP